MSTKFAVVKEANCNFTFNTIFTKLHETYMDAHDEAERLCRKENKTFYVIQLISKCYVHENPIEWKHL